MKIARVVFIAVLSFLSSFPLIAFSAENRIPAVTEKVRIVPETRNGFVHPGLGITKEELENARRKVIEGREPWLSHWRDLARDPQAGRDVAPRNESRTRRGEPDSDAWDSKGMQSRLGVDGLVAYKQALMHFFTGDPVYRRNAMRIIRVWSKMDPAKFRPYADCHIHSGWPLHNLLQAAEILRHAPTDDPSLAWTQEDTEELEWNLIRPAIKTFMNWNGWFMNQNNFAIMGAMTGFIFLDDREGYEQRVEWFTVNRDAPDQGVSGSIKQLARLVTRDDETGEPIEPRVQLAEMGRDQAHAAEDMNLFAMIARIIMNQGTLVDPVEGVPSKKENAIPAIEFLDHRILKAADHFCRFMLGVETPWTTIASSIDRNGVPRAFYRTIAEGYRGRWTTFEFWWIWDYYMYQKGWNPAEIAPYFDRAYRLRINPGNWILIPAKAAGPTLRYVPSVIPNDEILLVERTTLLDSKVVECEEDGLTFLRVKADAAGARIAMLSCASNARRVAMRVRTNGPATIRVSNVSAIWLLPDTQGEWRDVVLPVPKFEIIDNCHFLTISSESEATVDLDTFIPDAERTLRPPMLREAEKKIEILACAGIPTSVLLHSNGREPFRLWGAPDGVSIDSSGRISINGKEAGTRRFLAGIDDGFTVAICEIELRIAADRKDAVRIVSERRDPSVDYRKSSLLNFLRMKTKAVRMIETASDADFMQSLREFQAAADALEPLSPRLPDGSIDFTRIVESDLGDEIHMLTDGRKGTAPNFRSGLDLNYLFDFGPNFRVSLDSVEMLGWSVFDNRMADSTIFGSNDLQRWDRLSAEETPLTEKTVKLNVLPEFRDRRYRWIKFAKLHKRSAGIFTVSELRLFGKRFQINDAVESVSISSPSALRGRIEPGATVRIRVKLCEPVKNIRASICGFPAKIVKGATDFVAELALPRSAKPGKISFAIDYDGMDGAPAPTIDWTTDRSELFLD